MHWRSVAKVFGFLLILLAASMMVSLFWSVWYGTPDWRAFLWSIILVGVPGAVMVFVGDKELLLNSRDVYVVVAGGWVVCSLAGTIPFMLSGVLPQPADALFETVSGFTTTGATVMTRIPENAAGILFWRSYLNWLGGMGIILIFLALARRADHGGDSLYKAEVPGMEVERLTPRLRETASVLWRIYGTITLFETLLLWLAGMSLYESLIHAFSTVATGGFSSRTLSVGAYEKPWIFYIILVFMLLSGINFGLYYRAIRGRRLGALFDDPELRGYATIILVAVAILTYNLMGQYGFGGALRHGSFQAVSVMTTTGFTTTDFDTWPDLSKSVLLCLMFVGACSGSTAGAIKVVRFQVMGKSLFRELGKMVHPQAVLPVRLGRRVIPESTVRSVLVFSAAYMACALAGTFYMLLCGLDMVSAVSAVAATLGNVGPGLGSVGPSLSYASIPASGKVVLTFLMLLGRLEILTVLVTLTPSFWQRR